MRPPIEQFLAMDMGAELIYAFVIIICSLIVYFSTKELYKLTSHQGIKYFRQAFLFFAIAYFFRSVIKFILMFLDLKEIFEFSPMFLSQGMLFIFVFSSVMAIFSLLFSVMWKQWNNHKKLFYLFYVIAIVLSLVSTSVRKMEIIFAINLLLLIMISFITFMAYRESREKKKGPNLYIVYILLFIFSALNVIDILIPHFLKGYQLIIYLVSCGIFLAIQYKVLRKIGS